MTHGRQDRGPPFKGVGKKSRKHLPKLRKNASSYAKGRVGETRRRRWCCAPVLPGCIRSLLVLDVRARATARKHSCLEWHCDAGRQQPSNAHARARGCLFVVYSQRLQHVQNPYSCSLVYACVRRVVRSRSRYQSPHRRNLPCLTPLPCVRRSWMYFSSICISSS